MTKGSTRDKFQDQTELRQRAEERLVAREKIDERDVANVDHARAMHELEVYRVELEMQNDELRVARRDLELGLAQYTELFEFAPIGYATLDKLDLIEEINLAGAGLLGRNRSALVGKSFRSFIVTDQQPIFGVVLRKARQHNETERCSVMVRRLNDQQTVHLRISASVAGPAYRRTLLAFEDITEQTRREEQLTEAKNALREANLRTHEFLATLSHELRNPLAPIRNSLYLLERAPPGSEAAQKAQSVIGRQVTHLTRLVDDLLDMTRVIRGKIDLRNERIEVGELIRNAVEDLRLDCEKHGVALTYRMDSEQFWVNADAARIVQIVSNLLGNAEKFTPRGGRVDVTLQRSGSKVVLNVRDTGIGMTPEVMAQVFEPFVQAPQSIERSRGGLGLGLATVKGLVELHGGCVTISSPGLNQGTLVAVMLPLAEAPPKSIATVETPAGPNRRVLIIEDNVDAAETLRDALEMSGHDVDIAYDGPSGVEAASRLIPDIVICDIGLPGMDGYHVAEALRKKDELARVYLIALSGYAAPSDVSRARAAGFNKHLAKPFTIDALDRMIRRAQVV